MMKREYSKPELIDLNEQTGLGDDIVCHNGSGNINGCTIGNVATGRGCYDGNAPSNG